MKNKQSLKAELLLKDLQKQIEQETDPKRKTDLLIKAVELDLQLRDHKLKLSKYRWKRGTRIALAVFLAGLLQFGYTKTKALMREARDFIENVREGESAEAYAKRMGFNLFPGAGGGTNSVQSSKEEQSPQQEKEPVKKGRFSLFPGVGRE